MKEDTFFTILHDNGIHMILLWMILFVGLGLSAPPQSPENEAQNLLRNAQTWYYVARRTENSFDAHTRSQDLYKKALETLKNESSTQALALREQAQLGLDQTTPRLDNAHDTFRNVLWPIWWITEEDPTAEWYDDLFMKAAELCWDNIEYQIVRLKEPARIPVITRSFRNDQLPEKSLIDEMSITDRTQLLRDELLIYADTNQSLYGISDDHGRRVIGEKWNTFVSQKEVPNDIVQQLGTALKHQYIMLIDINIIDELPRSTNHTPIVRLDTQAYLINTNTGTIAHHIYVQGIGKDLRSQNLSALWWVLGMFTLTIIATIIRLSKDKEEHNLHIFAILIVAFTAFLLGGSLGEFAGDISADFLQDWGTPSYVREWTNFTIPYFPVLIWPFIHGFVVLIGPLIALAWISNKLRDIIDTFIENPKSHMLIIAPAAQAGAATWMFHPLIEGAPDKGLSVSVMLTFAAVACSFSIAKPLSDVLESKNINRSNILALLFCTVGLALLLPIGFYHDNAIWASALVVCCALLGVYYQKQAHSLKKSSGLPDRETYDDDKKGGSLERPLWLPLFDVELDICTHIEERKHLLIQAPSKYGATRTIREYTKTLHAASKKHLRIVVDEKNSLRPFSIIKDICDTVGVTLDLDKQSNLGSTIQGGLAQAGTVLSLFPAIGFFVDSVSEREGDENYTRSRIIEEGANFLIRVFQEFELDVLILEDLHHADPSSMEVLKRYMELETNPPSFVWNALPRPKENPSAKEQDMENFCKAVQENHSLTICDIPPLSIEKAQLFLQSARVSGLDIEILESLVFSSEHAIGRFQLLLLLMLEKGLLKKHIQEQEEGDALVYYEAKENLKEREIWDQLPQDIKKQELLRISHLDRDTKFILECASLCGQTCTVDELVAGSSIPEQQVLLKLEIIEQIQPPIIEDVSDCEKEFRFLNGMTRIALIDELTNTSSGNLRELAKSIHRGIISAHLKQSFLLDHEVLHHTTQLSGHEALLCSALHRVLLSYSKQCAWPEIIRTFEQYESRISNTTQVQVLFDIHVIAAKAYRFTGGQQNRDRMMVLLHNQIRTHQKILPTWSESRLFALFFTLCEGLFEEKDSNDLNELIELCTQQQNFAYPSLILEIFVFYQECADSHLKRNSPMLPQLEQILSRLQAIPAPYTTEYNMLYSSVFQTFANKYWHEHQLPRTATPQEHQENQQQLLPIWRTHMDEALQRKEEINDVQGIAINHGVRGGIYLFTMRHGQKALEFFQKDWDVVEENNMQDQKPGLKNKLAMSHILISKTASNPNDHLKKAQTLAMESLKMAEKMGREMDFSFAFGTVVDLLISTQEAQLIQKLAQQTGLILAESFWSTKFPPFLKQATHTKLQKLQSLDLCSEDPWFTLALQHTEP